MSGVTVISLPFIRGLYLDLAGLTQNDYWTISGVILATHELTRAEQFLRVGAQAAPLVIVSPSRNKEAKAS